jgi:succinoglycan biosynthesis protein ExoO
MWRFGSGLFVRRSALVVTDQRLSPPWGGNRVRILGVLRLLRQLRWHVILLTPHRESRRMLREYVDEVLVVGAAPFGCGNLSSFDVSPFRRAVARVAAVRRPAIAIAEYAWLAPALADCRMPRYVDCHDVLHERTARFTAARLDPWVVCTRDQERALLAQADVLIASQFEDEVTLRQLLPDKCVTTLLPPIHLPGCFAGARPAPSGVRVLAVGARHAGNSGIGVFVSSHWQRVRERIPDARLDVVGSVETPAVSGSGVQHHGHVANLHALYAAASVVLCPVEVGTGVKMKLLEALRFGRATVATRVAAEGLPRVEPGAWLECDSVARCADATVYLLDDASERARLARAAFAYGERFLSDQRAVATLAQILPRKWSESNGS